MEVIHIEVPNILALIKVVFRNLMFCRQPNASGAYMSAHPYGQEAPYPVNQFHAQNVVRPAGGNPFG